VSTVRLTDRLIRGLHANPGERLEVADDALGRGGGQLVLRVYPPTGGRREPRRVWSYLYYPPGQGLSRERASEYRRKRVSLGIYPVMTLESARALAREMESQVFGGRDPGVLVVQPLRVAAMWDDYLDIRSPQTRHSRRRRSPSLRRVRQAAEEQDGQRKEGI
jgi:hypothetical protein